MAGEVEGVVCIGCGCTENRACAGGCYWLRVNREEGKGVCSKCPSKVGLWDQANIPNELEV